MNADPPTVGERLDERRASLARELARLTAAPTGPTPAVSFGKRIGDGTTEAVERFNVTAAARSIQASIQEVDRALEKLAEGTYGTCDGCGAAIPAERLEAVPWAGFCADCAGRRSGRR